MKIPRNSRNWLFILLTLPALLAVPPAVQSADQQRLPEAPPRKPSAQTEPAQPTSGAQSRISDPAGLMALTEAPPAATVGLDEHLGTRLPLDLTFRDEDGRPLQLSAVITKPTVIAPVYYRCPNVCHFLQGELAQVLPQLKLAAGTDYQVLSISFDETETPELARRNRDTYRAAAGGKIPADGWRFLTGDLAEIMQLTNAIGYRFQRVGNDFQHPVAIVVISPGGTIVRYLHGTRILPKDLALALMEAREGHVGTTIRKMVQYCFSYDPEQQTYIFNLLRVSATVIIATLGIFLTYLIFGGKKQPKDRNS